jgi:hypothetical protein
MNHKKLVILFVLFVFANFSYACDLCGCFVPQDVEHGFQVGLGEQYSSSSNLSLDGEQTPNVANQSLNSWYTQLLVNYRFNARASLQLNAPLIHRSFRRLEGDSIQNGTESGLGDLLLLGAYTPFQRKNPSSQFQWKLLGGLKFPTGNSDPIGEELEEGHSEEMEARPSSIQHAEDSGVHGHDLALGSGSWDGLIGTALSGRSGDWFYAANVQYTIRTRGSFDYRYANDLLWYGGPGYYFATKPNYSFGLQALLAGEHKGEDELGNEPMDDTSMTAVYLGPNALIAINQMVMTEIGFGFPLSINNSGLQTVPKYRLRIGLTWHLR